MIFILDAVVCSDQVAKISDRPWVPAKQRCNTRHSASAEPIEHEITWFGIMQDVPHDRFMRDFSVVRMGVVNGVVLSFSHICSEWFAAIWCIRVVLFAV